LLRELPARNPRTLPAVRSPAIGSSGSSAQVAEKSPGAIVVGPLAATKMACPAPAMELESCFLAAMSRMTRYSFVDGRLVLSTIEGGAPHELVFERGAR
jgi:hypothetical protein